MKFLCDNCKAKYQIADEKVAGKTVRMKCRKCGHQIEVRAAVTETSTSTAAPRPPGAPPKPPVPRSGLATSLSAAKPRAPSASVVPGSALAGAFQRNVHDAPASVSGAPGGNSIELSVTDEWYVAINGVPVGPVRISELRRKAAAGAVTEESLCWQEGLEEWRPIRSIQDLAALVREAAQGNRASLIAPPPPETTSRGSIPPPRPQPPPPPPPRPIPQATARSNVVPLRPAASMDRASEDFGLGPSGGAAAAYAPSLTPAPPMFAPQPYAAPTPAPVPTSDPFALPPPAPTPYGRDSILPPQPGSPSLVSQAPYDPGSKKAGVPLWFWPILVLALGFGGGVAFLVFRPQPAPQPVVIQMPATATAVPTDKTDVPPPPATSDPAPATSDPKGKTSGPIARGGRPTTPAEEKKGLDLGNLVPGGGGPSVGPNNAPGASGGGLDQAGVERVVASHKVGVKRTCWERGGADQKSSVNVTVTTNVAPNGTVSSTSSTGDDPVVAKCIESQVKTWTFPAPGSNTTINIPFKFVRQ